jgi:uncharacterized protein
MTEKFAMPSSAQLKDGFGAPLTLLAPRLVKAPGFDWDYEVQIALPRSYAYRPDKRYPVLWLTDGSVSFNLAVGVRDYLSFDPSLPEMILVGVGCPRKAGVVEFSRRRSIDLHPPAKQYLNDTPGGVFLKSNYLEMMRSLIGDPNFESEQKADVFLAFLVDTLRPALVRELRMADDHALYGHSSGGLFANYAVFARPGAFRRFIILSPGSSMSDRVVFTMEQDYAEHNADLKADIFIGVGEQEFSSPLVHVAAGIGSSAILMAETLRIRQYKSLRLATRVFPGREHFGVVPDALVEGLRAVWSRDVEAVAP